MAPQMVDSINGAHESALEIVSSCASLLAAVKSGVTEAPYRIDATGLRPRKIMSPHEPRIKLCYFNLRKLMERVNKEWHRLASRPFTQLRVHGPFRSLGRVYPSAHFAAWDLGKRIEESVSRALFLSGRDKEHLLLPCWPRNANPNGRPPVGRYSMRNPNWLETRIKKHLKELSGALQGLPDPTDLEAELEWEFSRAISQPNHGVQLVSVAEPRPGVMRVVLRSRGDGAIVLGRIKRLTKSRYDVVKALLDVGDAGLSKDELVTKSGHEDARGILKRLAKSDLDWKEVIQFARVTGGGYRIK
jgi:hypothetical protein